jgi:hypothetical protein
MTKDEVISKLSIENLELKEEVELLKKILSKIDSTIYCVGGPLNDNLYNYSKQQLTTFWNIVQLIKGANITYQEE